MRALFSVRHADALKRKVITIPSLPMPLRRRLQAVASDFDDEVWITNDGWNNRSSVLYMTFPYLRSCLGVEDIRVVIDAAWGLKTSASLSIGILISGLLQRTSSQY